MADTNNIPIHMREENLDLAKQAEDQRATMTNLVVIIVSTIQGVLTQIGFVKNALSTHSIIVKNMAEVDFRKQGPEPLENLIFGIKNKRI
jgi:hypothetical protein